MQIKFIVIITVIIMFVKVVGEVKIPDDLDKILNNEACSLPVQEQVQVSKHDSSLFLLCVHVQYIRLFCLLLGSSQHFTTIVPSSGEFVCTVV